MQIYIHLHTYTPNIAHCTTYVEDVLTFKSIMLWFALCTWCPEDEFRCVSFTQRSDDEWCLFNHSDLYTGAIYYSIYRYTTSILTTPITYHAPINWIICCSISSVELVTVHIHSWLDTQMETAKQNLFTGKYTNTNSPTDTTVCAMIPWSNNTYSSTLLDKYHKYTNEYSQVTPHIHFLFLFYESFVDPSRRAGCSCDEQISISKLTCPPMFRWVSSFYIQWANMWQWERLCSPSLNCGSQSSSQCERSKKWSQHQPPLTFPTTYTHIHTH